MGDTEHGREPTVNTFETYTSPELGGRRDAVAVLPFGAIEQHGPHLPVMVDQFLVTEVAAAAAARSGADVLVCPTMPYGVSGVHLDFPGTISIRAESYLALLRDITDSLAGNGFRRVMLLNGHGGNLDLLKVAARGVRERHDECMVGVASYWQIAAGSIAAWRTSEPGGLCHAGEMETSLMLHLAPETVRQDRVEDHVPRWGTTYVVDDLLAGGSVLPGVKVPDVSSSGTLGQPSLGTADRGAELFDRIVGDVAAFLDDFSTWSLATLVENR